MLYQRSGVDTHGPVDKNRRIVTYYKKDQSMISYPIHPLFPCTDFVSQMWGGGNVFLAF